MLSLQRLWSDIILLSLLLSQSLCFVEKWRFGSKDRFQFSNRKSASDIGILKGKSWIYMFLYYNYYHR